MRLLLCKQGPPLVGYQSKTPPLRRESLVGVIDAEVGPELCSRGEHAIWLIRSLGHQVVNQNPEIAVDTPKDDGSQSADPAGRVYPSQNALGRRFLVSRGAIDLACQEQTLDCLNLSECLTSLGSTASYSIA